MLNLEIITPDRIAYTGEVDSVVVPGAEGTMGVLPRHINLFAQLVDGEVKIKKDKDEIYLAIGGGYIEVKKGKVSILVTRVAFADELNEQEILKAQKEATEALSTKVTENERKAAQMLFRRSLVDLKILRRRKKRSQ